MYSTSTLILRRIWRPRIRKILDRTDTTCLRCEWVSDLWTPINCRFLIDRNLVQATRYLADIFSLIVSVKSFGSILAGPPPESLKEIVYRKGLDQIIIWYSSCEAFLILWLEQLLEITKKMNTKKAGISVYLVRFIIAWFFLDRVYVRWFLDHLAAIFSLIIMLRSALKIISFFLFLKRKRINYPPVEDILDWHLLDSLRMFQELFLLRVYKRVEQRKFSMALGVPFVANEVSISSNYSFWLAFA